MVARYTGSTSIRASGNIPACAEYIPLARKYYTMAVELNKNFPAFVWNRVIKTDDGNIEIRCQQTLNGNSIIYIHVPISGGCLFLRKNLYYLHQENCYSKGLGFFSVASNFSSLYTQKELLDNNRGFEQLTPVTDDHNLRQTRKMLATVLGNGPLKKEKAFDDITLFYDTFVHPTSIFSKIYTPSLPPQSLSIGGILLGSYYDYFNEDFFTTEDTLGYYAVNAKKPDFDGKVFVYRITIDPAEDNRLSTVLSVHMTKHEVDACDRVVSSSTEEALKPEIIDLNININSVQLDLGFVTEAPAEYEPESLYTGISQFIAWDKETSKGVFILKQTAVTNNSTDISEFGSKVHVFEIEIDSENDGFTVTKTADSYTYLPTVAARNEHDIWNRDTGIWTETIQRTMYPILVDFIVSAGYYEGQLNLIKYKIQSLANQFFVDTSTGRQYHTFAGEYINYSFSDEYIQYNVSLYDNFGEIVSFTNFSQNNYSGDGASSRVNFVSYPPPDAHTTWDVLTTKTNSGVVNGSTILLHHIDPSTRVYCYSTLNFQASIDADYSQVLSGFSQTPGGIISPGQDYQPLSSTVSSSLSWNTVMSVKIDGILAFTQTVEDITTINPGFTSAGTGGIYQGEPVLIPIDIGPEASDDSYSYSTVGDADHMQKTNVFALETLYFIERARSVGFFPNILNDPFYYETMSVAETDIGLTDIGWTDDEYGRERHHNNADLCQKYIWTADYIESVIDSEGEITVCLGVYDDPSLMEQSKYCFDYTSLKNKHFMITKESITEISNLQDYADIGIILPELPEDGSRHFIGV